MRAATGSGKNDARQTSAQTATIVTAPQVRDCAMRSLFSAFCFINSIMFSSAFFR